MSYRFLPALAADCSPAIASAGVPSAPSNTTDIAKTPFCSDNATGSLTCSRFGTTSKLSTAPIGEGESTSLPLAFLASLLAAQESDEGPTTPGIVGPTPREYLARFDPVSRCWKTCQQSFLADTWETFYGTWPKSGLMQGGTFSERRAVELPICESGFSFWRTPTAAEAGARIEPLTTKDGEPAKGGERAYRTKPDGSKNISSVDGSEICSSVTLGQQVRFATPTAKANQDCPSMQKHPGCRAMFPSPRSGRSNTLDGGSKLSPDWVEWLMGWPVGWTSLAPLDPAEFYHWQEAGGGWWDEEKSAGGIVPRLTEGVENRVSRLKAIGNGQVPLCVVRAWHQLTEAVK